MAKSKYKYPEYQKLIERPESRCLVSLKKVPNPLFEHIKENNIEDLRQFLEVHVLH
jgi:hypothetical protein